MLYLVPGPLPCPEVVAVFYIRPAEVPTLFSVEGDAQVKQQNTVVGFLTYGWRCQSPSLSIREVFLPEMGLKTDVMQNVSLSEQTHIASS